MTYLPNLLNQYLTFLEKEDKSSLTVRNYRHYLSRFSDFVSSHFPTIPIAKFNTEVITEYLKFLSNFRGIHGEYLDEKTQAYHLIALRSFIKFLRSQNINTINPEIIPVPKTQSKPLIFLDNYQSEALLRLAENLRDKCILELILATGLRVSDLVKLSKNDVNFESNEINFKSKGGFRAIFLTQNALDWLEKYLNSRDDDSMALFIRKAGKKDASLRLTPRSVQRIVEKYVKKANLIVKATPSSLRHTFAINLLSVGTEMSAVQRHLDHKNISTTQIYTHVINPQLRDIHRKFHRR